MRRPIVLGIIASVLLALALAGAASASASERIDMKVLLLGTSTTEPDFVSWQAALQREGVPFQAIVTSPGHTPITAATLSDTLANGTPEGKYQAVIVSVGALPECTTTCNSTLSQAEWTALEEYEHTFSVRQLTGDIYPGATYGLNSPTSSGALDGTQGTLTTEGKTVFPYLKGSVAMDTGTYGYDATPLSTQVAGASFHTLVSGPSSSALVGIYTHPDGAQEMVESFDENQNQLQAELLRHGALNWVTRGVYFGDQRNYYEADIDDNFLSDDSWSTTEHTTDYNPTDAIRETPTDVNYAASWSAQNKFRMDMLFNGGGSVQYQTEHGSDPLLSAFQKDKGSFGWISHTWDHPNLDVGCASQSYIEAELNENTSWAATTLGLTESTSPTAALGNDNPSVIITGEHSGLANLLPGNPGVVDPPDLDSAEADTTEVEGTLPAGSYIYAVTDDFAPGGGQSIASESSPVAVTGSEGSVTLTWDAVCHAAEFKVYREKAGSNQWTLIATIPAPTQSPPNIWFGNPTTTTAVTGGGPLEVTYTDTGGSGTASGGPPAASEAVETAYPQNPNLIPAFSATGIQYFGSDASKAYPNPAIPGSTAAAYPAGSTFTDGTGQAIPRYPTNIYYNVSTEAEEVDEFNSLYTPNSEGGKCVASANTTCETKPATFAEIVGDVDTNMFQHVMGNDPRPHYFHQPNIMGSPPPGPPTTGTPPATSKTVGDGLFYSVLNPLLEEYNKYFSAPLEQATMAQIGQLLTEQQAWSAANTSQVSGYIEGNKVTVDNSGSSAVSTPLTGAGVGSAYGGTTSGWTSAPAATSTHTAQITWPESLRVTTASVPGGHVGNSYSQTPAASGGAPPYVWSITAGSLPAGLSLNTASGAITGTPTAATNSSFTLKVSDASVPTPQTATANLSITVLPNPPVVVTGQATLIAQTTATLSATVNPNAGEVSECKLEYGTTSSYGSSAPCTPPPGSGSSPVAVSASLTALTANTTYHFRISATNAGGTSTGPDETFQTSVNAPAVAGQPAAAVTQTTASLSATVNPNGGEVSECALEYGTTSSYGSSAPCTPPPGSGSSPVAVSASLTALTANTTYHFRISATNGGGTSTGPDETFSTPVNRPEVASDKASSVTQTAATINATVNPNSGEVSECKLEYGTTSAYGSSASCTPSPGSGSGPVAVSASLTGLSPNSTYHFRISATNAGGTSSGQDETFKTPVNPPTVVSEPASAVTQTTAGLRATVDPNGGEISECKLEYGTASSYGSSVPCTPSPGSGSGPVAVSASLTGLTANSTYHFRISAANASGTSTGSDETFKTPVNPPTVVTEKAGPVTQTGATLNATVNPNAGEVSECKLEYGTTPSYGSSAPCTPSPGSGSGPVAVSASLRGLSLNTTYHFRISATNSSGTSAGSDETLKTLPAPTLAASFTHTEARALPFGEPTAVAVSPGGNIFVADGSHLHDRILEFNAKHEYVRQFGTAGSGPGQLNGIGGIAISGAGELYVADSGNNRVEEFSEEGKYLNRFGSFGSENGQLSSPGGVALDPAGDVWVLDTANYRVQEFSSTGEYVAKFGSYGTGSGQLGWASGLAISGADLYVSEPYNARIQEFSSSGALIRQFDEKGLGNGKSNTPYGLATDPTSGNLYVVEGASILQGVSANRVQEFSPEGGFIASFGASGVGSGKLAGARGVAVGSSGAIFTADSGNQRIEEWAP